MKVLVCGGRNFDNAKLLETKMNSLGAISLIIEGGASGADKLANQFAEIHSIPVQQFKADWHRHGKAAGPMRNQDMLDIGRPDLVVAFEGGRGTADMVRRSKNANVEVMEIL